MKNYRHGEIALMGIEKLPEGLEASNDKVLMVGSHGNNHSLDNGTIYFKKEGDFVFGYLEANNTTLFHAEHGDGGKAEIEDGFYQLIKQNEFTPSGLIPIVD